MADGYEQIELLDKGNWRSKYMLNKQYYEGYEGEGEVKIWYEDGQDENGIVIWIGFWETILEGCYIPDYQSNGIIECYFNHNGFYDDVWSRKLIAQIGNPGKNMGISRKGAIQQRLHMRNVRLLP